MSENMEIKDEVLESAWGNEDDAGFGGEAEEQGTIAESKPEADQPKGAPQEPGQQADQPTAPELFTLKNRDETRQVTRDEMVALAQKGWDYDTVRAERDQLRQYRDEANPALELVKGYAQRNNMTVGDYLDFCRKQELVRQGMTEQDAAAKLDMEKERAALDAKQAEIQAQEQRQNSAQRQAQEAVQARQRDIAQFCRIYPGVDPKTIPQEVWEAVKGGDTLTNAYTMHENKRLAAELAAERQNKANQANTPGSLGGNAAAEMDEIDRLWAEGD